MKENWIDKIAKAYPFKHVYPEFLKDISPLKICPDYIRGKVLVIGQGCAFPEKNTYRNSGV